MTALKFIRRSKMDNGDRKHRECNHHAGLVSDLKSGRECMKRLETGFENLRTKFDNHFESSSKATIALLTGILMCFLTSVLGIYVNSKNPRDKLSSQAEMMLLIEEMTKAIKEAKK